MDGLVQPPDSKYRSKRPTLARVRGGEVRDLRRAVMELATIRGWHVPNLVAQVSPRPVPGSVFVRPMLAGSAIGWPDLALIRRRDRRLVFAMLAPDGASTLSPGRRVIMDLLGALEWDTSCGERRRAELALGRPAPSVEAVVWRPADLSAGTIDELLR